MKKFAFVLALLSVFAFGCNSKSGESDTIKIAVVGPMTGDSADVGQELQNAARMKVEEINAAGGIDGKKVEMVVMDDKGQSGEAANIARQLAADESISIVIGHFNSACTIAGREEYNRKGVVEFTPASTNVSVCKGYEWTFRNLYRDDYQGRFLAHYAKDALGMKKVAVFFDNDDYGAGLKNYFVDEAGKIGLEVGDAVSFERLNTTDYKPLVERIRGKGYDGVFVSGLYHAAGHIAKVVRTDLQLDIPILGGDGVFAGDYLSIAGNAAEGTYISTPFMFDNVSDSPEAVAFYDAYVKQFEKQPGAWAALGYDAMGMTLKAIQEVGTDRKKIKEWFAACTSAEKGYKGVTGVTYFDSEGDCYSKGATVAVVKDGKFLRAPKQFILEQ